MVKYHGGSVAVDGGGDSEVSIGVVWLDGVVVGVNG